jgi:pimeloyl-ACP methyl ester carboxylesterase
MKSPNKKLNGYQSNSSWQEIQSFLPEKLRLEASNLPTEEWWSHRGHQIHLDTYRNPQAPAKLILFHGVGTNGRQMTTILGAPMANLGYECIATDMPGYGMTQIAPNQPVTYDEWVQIGSDLIDIERAKDPRPIFLYGLSAGGMLTYHVAAKNPHVKGIIGMTFLDQSVQQVADETAFNVTMGRMGAPAMKALAKTPLAGTKIPMRVASRMSALVNDPAALKAFYQDKTSAGNWVPVKFLSSYMSYQPLVKPEEFDVCPILLTQPAQDRWSPLHLSEPFLKRIKKVKTQIVMLENAGHYPIEQPGLYQMQEAIAAFIKGNL